MKFQPYMKINHDTASYISNIRHIFSQKQVSEKTFRHMLLESINNYFRDPENLENLEIMVINESLVEK